MKKTFTRTFMVPVLSVVVAGLMPSYAASASKESVQLIQQSPVTFTGVVTDQQDMPLPGVSISVKGTGNGTVTDQNGAFTLTAAPGSTIVFSFIGFLTQEVTLSGQSTLNVQLKEDMYMLNEVVAVGYQTVRRSDVTGAISNVKAEELNLSAPTVGQSLVGKVAGVQVSQVSGAPYVGTKIRVRGVGSINASSDPLYVIDGYPAGNDVFINPNDIESIDILKDAASAAIYGSRAAGGVVLITTKRGKEGKGRLEYDYQFGIHQLSKKIDLLNAEEFGQLMIDARNGTYRDLVVNAGKPWSDAMYSDDNATRIANVGNASAVSIPTYLYDFPSQRLIKPQYDTDWQDELYRNAAMHRHNLSFMGGTQSMRYALSGGYQKQEGIIVSTGQERLNFRANLDADVNSRLKVGANLALTSADSREVQEGRFNQGPILGALVYMPIFRAYNEDGSLAKNEAASQSAAYGFQNIENPVALARETQINRKGVRGTYNGYASLQILPDLFFKTNLGLQTYNEKYEFYNPTSLSSGANPPGSPQALAAARATAQTIAQEDQLAEFTLNYNRDFARHNLNVLGGYSAQKTYSDLISVSARGFQNDRIPEITGKGAEASDFFMNSVTGKSTHTLLSYFGRAAYRFDDKYFLTATFRADGSSRFGPLNRWGYFPSVSAGWTISNEPFYQSTFGTSSSAKLRASWGLSGNNNIGNYSHEQVMASPGGVVFGSNTIATAIWSEGIKDQNLGWESTSQYNVGLDLGLFNNRLQVISNFYISRSFDLLFNQPISAVSGVSSMLTNLPDSKVENKGFDIQVDGSIVSTKDFTFSMGGNISVNRNKVLDMGGASTIFSRGAERSYLTHVTQEGYPIGMFYGFKVKGMVRESDLEKIAIDNANFDEATQSFPEGYVLQGPPRSMASSNPLKPGDLYFEDVNGDGVVNDEDKRVIGSPHPKFTYGLSVRMSYKNFDLSSAFNGVYGNQVLDGQDYYIFNMEGSGNQYAEVANRYQSEAQPGDGTIYRAARGGTQSNSTRLSTFYLQDGSFFRWTNLQIGYTLPKGIDYLGISNLRIYANIDNVLTLSDYKGYNPEVDYNNGSNLTPGVDYGKYPLVRAFSLGARVTF